MDELKSYETYTRGNVDENEIVSIKIFTHNTIDELNDLFVNILALSGFIVLHD